MYIRFMDTLSGRVPGVDMKEQIKSYSRTLPGQP
jgi:hypothetical protein